MPRREDHNQKSSNNLSESNLGLVLTETTAGVVLPVYAQPGARRNGIVGLHSGRLKIAVTQVAEKGQANAALAEVLAAELNLKRGQVHLQTGETNRRKTFLIQGVTVGELHSRLTSLELE